jgi:hypothetical protein
LKETLNRIDKEIESGLKLKAVDRLRNLINEYPNDLTIWDKLANLYYDSGFLDAAGCYWILFEPNDERKKKSIEAYKKTVNNSGYQILQEITFRGDKDKLPEYAKRKLIELESDSKQKVDYVPKFSPKRKKTDKKTNDYEETFRDKLIKMLIIGIVILIPVLSIIGLIRVIQWII